MTELVTDALRTVGRGDAIPRPETQFRERGAEAELRLLAPAALFPSPRHTQTPTPPEAGD